VRKGRGESLNWTDGVLELSKAAGRHPQAAHAGLQKSPQQEWQFLQQVTSGLSNEFKVVEEILAEISCHPFLETEKAVTLRDN
jgi:hypothetical protein